MTTKLLKTYNQAIQDEWNLTVHRIITLAKIKNSASAQAAAILEQYLQNPGKFVRPTLFLTSYEMYAHRKPSKQLVALAMSFELLQVYLLIQDDIMDQSDQRRGGPSLHKRYETDHTKRKLSGNASRFGESLAMLMSDLLANEAEVCWTKAEEESLVAPKQRRYFDILKEEVYWGQYLDLLIASRTSLPILEDIVEVGRKKTGEYTIYRPMQIGALVGGATESHTAWLRDAGLNFGVAYQAIDDILGTFGDPGVTGKSADSDLIERKYTPFVLRKIALITLGSSE